MSEAKFAVAVNVDAVLQVEPHQIALKVSDQPRTLKLEIEVPWSRAAARFVEAAGRALAPTPAVVKLELRPSRMAVAGHDGTEVKSFPGEDEWTERDWDPARIQGTATLIREQLQKIPARPVEIEVTGSTGFVAVDAELRHICGDLQRAHNASAEC